MNAPSAIGERYARLCSRLTTSGRVIPEVDGLRFIAILTVVVFHCREVLLRGSGAALGDSQLAQLLIHGAYGVNLFFLISGFVLAVPFARSALQGDGPVALDRYFKRRLTRIEPPYLVSLLGFFLVKWLVFGQPRTLLPHLATGVFYLNNLLYRQPSPLNSVSWTLEIEVQFYVLMPLLAAGFRIRRAVLRRALWIGGMALVAVLDAPLPDSSWVDWTVVGYLPYFLAGLLLADLHVMNDFRTAPASLWWDALALGCVGALIAARSLGLELLISGVLFVACYSLLRGQLSRRFLRSPWVFTTGGMCYSMYLIHLPLIVLAAKLVGPRAPFALQLLELSAVALPLVWVASIGYFRFIERPCMDPAWPQRLAATLWGSPR